MELSNTATSRNELRKSAWNFQKTFLTPVNDLKRFVETIVSSISSIESGAITVEQAVFTPTHLSALLLTHSIPSDSFPGLAVVARDRCELEELLKACFRDWLDFAFVPKPKPFVVFADHDEYTTF